MLSVFRHHNKKYLSVILEEWKIIKQAPLSTSCMRRFVHFSTEEWNYIDRNSLDGRGNKGESCWCDWNFQVRIRKRRAQHGEEAPKIWFGPLLIWLASMGLGREQYCSMKEDSILRLVLEDIRVPTIQNEEKMMNILNIQLSV